MRTEGWISQTITPGDRAKATDTATKRREYMRTHGYPPIFQSNALTNEVNGLLGEIKFSEYLKKDPNLLTDSPGSFDVKLGRKVIDVKTNESKAHPTQLTPGYKFLINKAQYDKHLSTDIYFSVLIYSNTAWICGFITRDKVAKYPIVNPGFAVCYTIPFYELSTPDTVWRWVN